MGDSGWERLIGAERAAVDTPALLIDLDALERNLRTMADFFRDKPAKLRPHAKTHKSPIVARQQLALGAVGITCAKLGEAEVLAAGGIADILVANQVIGPVKIARLVALLERGTRVTVAVDDVANLRELAGAAEARGVEVGVLIEVNTGMNRCGVEPGAPAVALARAAADLPNIRFRGLQAYEGHLVGIADEAERAARVAAAMAPVLATRAALEGDGLPVELVSGGGTGTFAITGALDGFDEIQAGSYVFMDAQYATVGGVGGRFAQALTVLASVVSRPAADRMVLDIGRKSLGIDQGAPYLKGFRDCARFDGFSEEHARLTVAGPARDLRPGDQVEVVPGHGCTTVNLHDRYVALRGDVVEAIWPIAARGRAQ